MSNGYKIVRVTKQLHGVDLSVNEQIASKIVISETVRGLSSSTFYSPYCPEQFTFSGFLFWIVRVIVSNYMYL